ncbi:4390_t:CDS:2 [Entrophospora sp. SA101]|nr:4390_t:CDS:2 [Entrophospora sp. SA101]
MKSTTDITQTPTNNNDTSSSSTNNATEKPITPQITCSVYL